MEIIRKKILCVDDDQDDLSFLSEAIHSADPTIEVLESFDGTEAIDYLSNPDNPDPSLIFLDINMPMLGGKETLKIIREELELIDIPIIILTSSKNPNDKIFFEERGIEMCTKPVNLSDLDELVKGILDQYS